MKLENILDLSLNEYLSSVDKKESDYHVKGVRASFSGSIESHKGSILTPADALRIFRAVFPEGTEAVVNYKEKYLVAPVQEPHMLYTPFQCIMTGVALIPKTKPSE